MAPTNVELAARHARALGTAYTRVLKTGAVNALVVEEFEEHLRRNVRVGINCRPIPLESFLTEGVYKNLHRLIEEGRAATPRYGYRVFVERYLGLGPDTIYGSLNTGNCGARFHGDYCVILRNESIRDRVSFARDDSFKYMTATKVGAELRAKIRPGYMATWENVNQLSVVKLQDELAWAVPRGDVPSINSVVCGYFDSIEAQISGEVTLDDVEAVRIHHLEYVRGLFYASRRKVLPEDQEIELLAQEKVLAILNQEGVRVEIAP